MRRLGHLLVYLIALPIASRLHPGVLALLFRMASLPLGFLLWLKGSDRVRRILTAVGRRHGPVAEMGYSIADALERLRSIDFYIYSGTPTSRLEWDEGSAPAEPCIIVCLNVHGRENLLALGDRFPSVVVRRRWGAEEEADQTHVPLSQRWRAHQAAARRKHFTDREVIVGDGPFGYRRAVADPRSIAIYQDVWDPDAEPGETRLLGRPTPLPLGALRLAALSARTSATSTPRPIRYATLKHRGGAWIVRVSAPIEATAASLIARMDADIRARPAAWAMWDEWLEYQSTHARAGTLENTASE